MIEARLAAVRHRNSERAVELRRLFAEAGCGPKSYSEVALRSSSNPNLVCVLPGSSPGTVVVTAHYDRKGPGEGAVDNWTGASLLPSLYEALRRSPRRLTYEFVAFTDEELGLIGSREYVLALSRQRRSQIALAVNIDSIGLAGPIRIAAERTDQTLMHFAAIVGDRMKIPISAAALGRRVDSDASAFISMRIPAIDFHSVTTETMRMLHTKADTRQAVDRKSYYEHYRFLSAFLEYLDENVEAPLR